ncbi:similar to Saccharomyces cerevisiae YNL237W YTP1 Probable type-III integral membrane protein of unknown function, has regions of similarity to mitochondrial electron transport proteins [Maudiozyma saulgeensis]|uniref:Protein YTP1-like C-terminal domain-containing protein n=1 Tax=Maudiozyma saulgeensis TaxID=1789683 RepID=A0A1X7R265_9SACH|nr:similar to Saccharomyces cerevisiae YNL237W YTP1 Probable type-III integral membrane protein of unknown function, has regions of similarity to mitochondrial electron transport proteins [Kazachstania saulgeensis]
MIANILKLHRVLLVLTCFILPIFAMQDSDMHMSGMDDTSDLTSPEITNGTAKSFHWIATVFFLFMLPGISSAFSFAKKTHTSVLLQGISGVYALLEATILRFPDGKGVENVTSRATAWIVLILTSLSLFFGMLNSGTKLVISNKRLNKFASAAGEKTLNVIHSYLSLFTTIVGWVKVCLAPISMFGFCRDGHTGQCLAHGIMGSSFVLYGFIYSMVLQVPWLRNSTSSYSQDYIDSWIMCLYGIVNTFTEHRWGREEWFMHDYQHTAMGIIWWAGGILGIYLGRNNKRTFIPSLLIIFTGWSMTQHSQRLIISTKVHLFFGIVLMIGGALRIFEISVLLRDKRSAGDILSFQYLAPFCLVSAGILFMGATEEQVTLVLRLGAEQSSYILVALSGAFLVYFWILVCLDLYVYLAEEHDQIGFLNKYVDSRQIPDPRAEFELEEDINDEPVEVRSDSFEM